LESQNSEEDVVVQGNGLSRGDKRRNAKLGVLRELVPAGNAILGIDLAAEKQVLVLADHDSRVLARKRVQAKAWDLGPVLDWACRVADKHGFAGVTVGCEPTGHRWRVLNELAAQRDMTLMCVNPMLVGRAREAEDYTRDKSDDKDAILIARLVAQLHCYVPERADETWARLRQLGVRRERLITEATACVGHCVICWSARGPAYWLLPASHLSRRTGVRPWRCSGRPAVRGGRSGWPPVVWRGLRPRCAENCPVGVDRDGGEPSSRRCLSRWSTRPG